jgi:hypothetical protein
LSTNQGYLIANHWILTPIRGVGRLQLLVVGEMGRMGIFLAQTLFCAFALRDAYYQYRCHLVENAEGRIEVPAGPLPID